MSQAEARAWWADVEHLRDRIERRRAEEHAGAGAHERREEERRVTARGPQWREASREAPTPARRTGATAATAEARPRRGVDRPAPASDTDAFVPRRTVRIRGQAIPTVVAPRLRPVDELAPISGTPATEHPPSRRPDRSKRRRPRPRAAERVGTNPDRIALWAVALGLLLALVAVVSAHGATGRPVPHASETAYLHVRFGQRSLARGMSGRDVRTLAHLLGVSPTGLFGSLTVRVIDRGPSTSGVGFDFTTATAAALGMGAAGPVLADR